MFNQNTQIPQHLHLIWLGDKADMPNQSIASWVGMNPGWKVHLWLKEHLETLSWHNEDHLKTLLEKAKIAEAANDRDAIKNIYTSISDIMRYEILFAVGGFYVDAKSYCVRSLEPWLFDGDFCVASDNETAMPGLLINDYLACTANHPILLETINNIHHVGVEEDESCPVWIKTGSMMLKQTIDKMDEAHNITIWPSHYFPPSKNVTETYCGTGAVFARNLIDQDLVNFQTVHNFFNIAAFPVFNELVTTPSGPRLINRNDTQIGRLIRAEGVWGVQELYLLKNYIPKGGIIIEGGANIGAHTVDLCRMVGTEGKVIAFEPQRLVFQELCANLALNNVPNCFCHNKALGAEITRSTMPSVDYYKQGNFGDVSLLDQGDRTNDLTASDCEKETTEIITIDSLSLSRLDFVKLDVEGMENAVLNGATETIKKFNPIIYMESHNDGHGAEARAYARSLGYKLYRIIVMGEQNVLCLPQNSTHVTDLEEIVH
ncbi:FkbM family methyltransferase [Aristophania vespae]|uniref:FkbM family methyltransferase n=1 Tax=Aristophania vespae TaxID=2697033 RepID=A0A6P1NMA3_9PROT|nr:FkbM family methyltransferase [Aristophania vespae]QHI95981.1 FkbM family methyltransferase [Aristophania vespae]